MTTVIMRDEIDTKLNELMQQRFMLEVLDDHNPGKHDRAFISGAELLMTKEPKAGRFPLEKLHAIGSLPERDNHFKELAESLTKLQDGTFNATDESHKIQLYSGIFSVHTLLRRTESDAWQAIPQNITSPLPLQQAAQVANAQGMLSNKRALETIYYNLLSISADLGLSGDIKGIEHKVAMHKTYTQHASSTPLQPYFTISITGNKNAPGTGTP